MGLRPSFILLHDPIFTKIGVGGMNVKRLHILKMDTDTGGFKPACKRFLHVGGF